jgi:cyclopropane-fatty-acyl-phospholipid synthase
VRRRLCAERVKEEERRGNHEDFVAFLALGPVAPVPEKANEQHYEIPGAFYRQALGPRLKYSCCFWEEGTQELRRAEERALQITCERAQIEDGQQILELGCGWGSLSLWLAERGLLA